MTSSFRTAAFLAALPKISRHVFDFDRKRIPAVLIVIAICSTAGLIVSIFRWQLVNVLTVFLEPILEIAVFGAFTVSLVWAIIHALYPLRGIRRNRYTPLLVSIFAAMLFIFVPFTTFYLKANFYLNLHARDRAAEQIVHSRSLTDPTQAGRGDPVELPGLSDGGQGIYWHIQDHQLVLFLTFRGLLDHFSGFVYSETDAAPERNDFGGNLVEVEHLRKHWYWVASI